MDIMNQTAITAQMGKPVTIWAPELDGERPEIFYSFESSLSYRIPYTGVNTVWNVPISLLSSIPDRTVGSGTITMKYSGGVKMIKRSFTAAAPAAEIPTVKKDGAQIHSVNIGDSIEIVTNRPTERYKHTVTYEIGGSVGEIATGVEESCQWTIPDLSDKIENAASAVMTITSTAFHGTAQVGSASAQIELMAPPEAALTLSHTQRKLGETLTIGIEGGFSAYSYDLSWQLGGMSGKIGSGVGASTEWSIPYTLISAMPDAVSGTMQIVCATRNGSAVLGYSTASLTLTAADPTLPGLPAEEILMGSSMRIVLNSLVDSYTHTVGYSFGEATGVIRTVEGSGEFLWKVPKALAAQIKTQTSGTGYIYCQTNNGSAVVGTKSAEFTARVPEDSETRPVLSMSLTPIATLPDGFSGWYVQGKSRVSAAFTASSAYADIESYTLLVNGEQISAQAANPPAANLPPISSGPISANGEVSVRGSVTDSRGFTSSVTQKITVYPYSRPRVIPAGDGSCALCARCNADGIEKPGGEYMRIRAGRRYSKVEAGGVQRNFCTLGYSYKAAGGDSYLPEVELLGESGEGDTVDVILPGVILSPYAAYSFRLYVQDTVGEKTYLTAAVPSVSTPMHLGNGGKNLGLGQYCDYTHPERIDVGWETAFHKGAVLQEIYLPGQGTTRQAGEELTGAQADRAMQYTLFLAAVGGVPVLCARLQDGNSICGQYGDGRMSIAYDGQNHALTVGEYTFSQTLDGLWALL